jgi:hypothetical protein
LFKTKGLAPKERRMKIINGIVKGIQATAAVWNFISFGYYYKAGDNWCYLNLVVGITLAAMVISEIRDDARSAVIREAIAECYKRT